MARGGFALDMKPTGFGLVPLGYHATAVHAAPLTDTLYLVLSENNEPTHASLPVTPEALPGTLGETIYTFNASGAARLTYRWKSKLYVLAKPVAFLAVQVRAETYANTVIRVFKQVLTAGAWVDTLLREVAVSSDAPVQLPMLGDYPRFWWEVIGTDTIHSVNVVEDIEELG